MLLVVVRERLYICGCGCVCGCVCERVINDLLLVLYGQDSYDYDLITIIMGNIDNRCIN